MLSRRPLPGDGLCRCSCQYGFMWPKRRTLFACVNRCFVDFQIGGPKPQRDSTLIKLSSSSISWEFMSSLIFVRITFHISVQFHEAHWDFTGASCGIPICWVIMLFPQILSAATVSRRPCETPFCIQIASSHCLKFRETLPNMQINQLANNHCGDLKRFYSCSEKL